LQSTFSHSKLVRVLGQWTPVDADAPGMDVAERLGLWLNAFDAIGLQASQQAIRSIDTPVSRKPSHARLQPADSLAEDVQRLRATLAKAIAAPVEDDGTFAAFQQRQLKLQRDMEQMVAPLRDHARQVLAQASTSLRQLAALDAAMEQALATREQKALATIGALLDRRYKDLRRVHKQDDDTSWLATYRAEWQQALLAELELRLEPLAGLVAALHNESKNQE
jgi:erythromycin esterase-like protein